MHVISGNLVKNSMHHWLTNSHKLPLLLQTNLTRRNHIPRLQLMANVSGILRSYCMSKVYTYISTLTYMFTYNTLNTMVT